jgi:hypothetical protein
MSRKKSGGISWIKKEEPKFIRQFKERIAYKEQATANTKVKFKILITFYITLIKTII